MVKLVSKVSKVLIGFCSICNRKKSMTVSDNTIQAEGLGGFSKNWGKNSAKAGKNLATNALKNPGSFLKIGCNVASAAASRNAKAALSTLLEVITFYHTGKHFYLPRFLCFVLYHLNGAKNTRVKLIRTFIRNFWTWTNIRKEIKFCKQF